jgi:hypothetical protein
MKCRILPGLFGAGCLVVGLWSGSAAAQVNCQFGGYTGYHVTHGYDIAVPAVPDVVQVIGDWQHVTNARVARLGQPPCTDPKNAANSVLLPVGASTQTTVSNACAGVTSDANSGWLVNAPGAANHYTGRFCSYGKVDIQPAVRQVASGDSRSATGLVIKATGRRGRVRYRFEGRAPTATGGVRVPRRQRDPIAFEVKDTSGTTLSSGTLLDVDLTYQGGPFSAFCINDAENCPSSFQLAGSNFDFTISMNPEFIPNPAERGNVRLSVRNRRVVRSEADGVFAGLVPGMGATAPLTFASLPDFDFDYDLGELPPGANADLKLSGQGEMDADLSAPVPLLNPRRAGLLGLGLMAAGLIFKARFRRAPRRAS